MRTLHGLLPDTEATLEFGRVLAALLGGEEAPRAVLLQGDLGSGKTTLVRGLVVALPGGGEAEVASPSFTILNMYPTKPPVVHADLFRCPQGAGVPEELEEALDPCAQTPGQAPLVFVEWPEHLPEACVPPKRLDILLEPCQGSRRFSLAAYGKGAEDFCADLAARIIRLHPDWQAELGEI